MREPEPEQGHRDAAREHDRPAETEAQAPEKEGHHEKRQDRAGEQAVPDALHRGPHQVGLVVEHLELDIGRHQPPVLGEPAPGVRRDPDQAR